MSRRSALTGMAIALAAAAALVACGDSDSSSSSGGSGSVEQTPYGKELAKLCREASKSLSSGPPFPDPNFNALQPDASQLPAIGRFFENGSLPVFEKIEAKAQKLQPSAGEKQHLEAFVRQLDARVANLKQQIAAAKASDVSGFVATVKAADASTQKLQTAEAQLGVSDCTGIS
jgi:hypothetical protein